MTQKQIFGVVTAAVAVVVASVFIYWQFTSERTISGTGQTMILNTTSSEKMKTPVIGVEDVVVPVPDTIDGIAAGIESETALDLSALDDEEAGSLNEITADSDSVTNLGTSYDENNL